MYQSTSIGLNIILEPAKTFFQLLLSVPYERLINGVFFPFIFLPLLVIFFWHTFWFGCPKVAWYKNTRILKLWEFFNFGFQAIFGPCSMMISLCSLLARSLLFGLRFFAFVFFFVSHYFCDFYRSDSTCWRSEVTWSCRIRWFIFW